VLFASSTRHCRRRSLVVDLGRRRRRSLPVTARLERRDSSSRSSGRVGKFTEMFRTFVGALCSTVDWQHTLLFSGQRTVY